MVYQGYADRRNEFYRNRDLYYNFNSRSPTFVAQPPSSDSDARNIRGKFCPLHGGQVKFDGMIRNKYFAVCCGMTIENEEMGIDVKDIGLATIDGRTSRNPLYKRTSGSTGGLTIVPAGQSRSTRNRKPQLSPDDQQLVRQGYQIISTQEKISTSKTLQPTLSSSSQTDSYRRDPIQEKYNRRIHGLGHI